MDTTTQHNVHHNFGSLLKSWREQRKLSQLKLALAAEISQRHLSFLESGRAKPSRDMVLLLGEVLDIPLRERNFLLNSAGFTAGFQQRDLQSDEMAAVRSALDKMLEHHPYPAIVIDKGWDLIQTNTPADRFLGLLGTEEELWPRLGTGPSGQERNIMRLTLHPAGLQPMLSNWDHVATLLISRLHREVSADPSNVNLCALFNEVVQYPGIPNHWRQAVWSEAPQPVLPLQVAMGGNTLSVFSMISTFGTAVDITADEIRVESFFPADDFSTEFLQQLAN